MSTATWPGHTARRPAAFVDQPTVPAQPVAVPAPTVGPAPRGEQWTWTATDLPLIPIALILAASRRGTRRRPTGAVQRRGTSYRPGSTR